MSQRTATLWTFAITSVALFMTTLDNLVVTTALPVIRKDLDAGLSGLEWTVNAYTLTFAVLLITGAALGDRFGRRRMFGIGLAIFTLGSAAAALAPSIEVLIAARAVQAARALSDGFRVAMPAGCWLSAGVAIVHYKEDLRFALEQARSAERRAKNTGRNRVGFYRPDMEAPAIKRSSIESELRSALDKHEFELFYQPTIDLDTGIISGAEALMRWRHPEKGLVPPDQFIPAAEASGLIIPMGRWALGEACRQAKAWQDAGLPPIPIAVNVSALQLRRDGLCLDGGRGFEPGFVEGAEDLRREAEGGEGSVVQ